MNAQEITSWRERHRFCADTPPPIESLDQARTVLDQHTGHDPNCRQLAAALDCVSVVR